MPILPTMHDNPKKNHLLASLADEEWQRWHVYQGKPVKLTLPDGGAVNGMAQGVADNGALLLATRSGQLHVHSGELSLRAGDKKR